jgi:hypothetical protein
MAQWTKGRSGNPKGRPKAGTAIADLARREVDRHRLIEKLGSIGARANEYADVDVGQQLAPAGQHDDTVMALALAWSAVSGQHRLIYAIPDTTIVVPEFAIPDHWPRAYGLDIRRHTAGAVWGAMDPDSDVLYLYREYIGEADPAVHAAAIRAPHD